MTGVSVVANPSFTPPRMEVTCTVPAGNVMKTAVLNRVVNGVSTPTLTQPAPGFDTQVVYDYLAPYGVPVSYEFIATYGGLGAVLWDELWASLSNWTGDTTKFAVAGGLLQFNASAPGTFIISRSVTPASYHVSIASIAIQNATLADSQQSGVQFVNAAGQVVLRISATTADGTICVYSQLTDSAVHSTSMAAASGVSIDFNGTSITVNGATAGGSATTYTVSGIASSDFSTVQVQEHFNNPPNYWRVGEIKVTNYVPPASIDVTSAPSTLASSQAWLIHPGQPSLSVPISSTDRSAVAVQNLGTITQASASTLHQILGQSLPIATHSGPRYGDTQQIALKARTAAHEAALNGILADSTPLLFRFPASFDAGFDEGFYSFGQVQRSRIAQRYGAELRQFVADITKVQQPTLTVQNTGWSWAALAAAFPTWQAVAAAYNTWADVLTNNRKPGY